MTKLSSSSIPYISVIDNNDFFYIVDSPTTSKKILWSSIVAQAQSDLNTFTQTVKGFVPAPTTLASKFLKDDGTWAIPTATAIPNINNSGGSGFSLISSGASGSPSATQVILKTVYSAHAGLLVTDSGAAIEFDLDETNIGINDLRDVLGFSKGGTNNGGGFAADRLIKSTGTALTTTSFKEADVITANSVHTLTNKTIDATNNTITNISNNNVIAGIVGNQTASGAIVNTDEILIKDGAGLKKSTFSQVLTYTKSNLFQYQKVASVAINTISASALLNETIVNSAGYDYYILIHEACLRFINTSGSNYVAGTHGDLELVLANNPTNPLFVIDAAVLTTAVGLAQDTHSLIRFFPTTNATITKGAAINTITDSDLGSIKLQTELGAAIEIDCEIAVYYSLVDVTSTIVFKNLI